jgi:RNA polymerase sigma factor for flagellar operon FliA
MKTIEPSSANRLTPAPVNPAAPLPAGARDASSPTAPRLQNFPDGPELWRLYQQQSSSQTENALIECYLPLVGSILNRLAGTLPDEVDREDLYSAGLVGLLGALRKFNPTTGVPFDTYARQRVRGAMLDELRRMDWVPRVIREKSRGFQKVTGRLEQQLGRSPTKTESAQALEITVTEYDELVAEIRPVQFLRLDAACEHDPEGETLLGELIPLPEQVDPSEQASASDLQQVILARLKQMPKIQQQVLTLYFLEGLYLHEIAETLGLTEGRICQIHIQAVQSLRAYLKRYENGLAEPRPAQVRDNGHSNIGTLAGHHRPAFSQRRTA